MPDRPYAATIKRWANSAYDHNRDVLDHYGPHWSGGSGTTDHGCQHRVLDLFNADAGS
ncbi:hypothetical protein ACIBRY_36040 [Streptomyces anulatus]